VGSRAMASENFSLAVGKPCSFGRRGNGACVHGLFELLLLEEFVSFGLQSVGHDGAFDRRAAWKVAGYLSRMGLMGHREGVEEPWRTATESRSGVYETDPGFVGGEVKLVDFLELSTGNSTELVARLDAFVMHGSLHQMINAWQPN
jgi:hypothetical protein